jgi:threonine/homoserine/homoserine lactone efflux protein
MLIYETTFLVLAFANAAGYAILASRARNVVKDGRAVSIVNRAGGAALIGAGALTLASTARS